MRTLLVSMFLACGGASPALDAGEPEPCGCDARAEAEGRLCHRLTAAELDAVRGEVGPGWENCPPLPND